MQGKQQAQEKTQQESSSHHHCTSTSHRWNEKVALINTISGRDQNSHEPFISMDIRTVSIILRDAECGIRNVLISYLSTAPLHQIMYHSLLEIKVCSERRAPEFTAFYSSRKCFNLMDSPTC